MKTILLLSCCLITQLTFAQSESAEYLKYLKKKKYVEGYVLLKDSTRVYGALTSPSGLLNTLKMVTKQGESKAYQFPEILAYQRKGNYYETDGNLVYLLIKRGKQVSYYERIVTTSTSAGPNGMMMTNSRTIKYFRKTVSRSFEQIGALNFARDMAKYFADCPSLSQRLEQKMYNYSSAEVLVSIYDRCEIIENPSAN